LESIIAIAVSDRSKTAGLSQDIIRSGTSLSEVYFAKKMRSDFDFDSLFAVLHFNSSSCIPDKFSCVAFASVSFPSLRWH